MRARVAVVVALVSIVSSSGGRAASPTLDIPVPAPMIHSGAWAESLKEHPRLFGPRTHLQALAKAKPQEYKEVRSEKSLHAVAVTHAVEGVALWPVYAADRREPTAEQFQQMLRRFPDADLNKDGKLTRAEFLEFRRKMQPEGTAASSRPTIALAKETPAAATSTALAGKVEIRISSAKPVRINPKIYGINCAEMFIFGLVQKPEYLSALRVLLRIGTPCQPRPASK